MAAEVYPRAPVQFVSLMTRFPLVPDLQRMEGKEAIYRELAESLPLLEAIEVPTLGGLGISVGQPNPPATGPRQIRMMNRERTRSVTLGPQMLLFECTDHESFPSLQEIVQPAWQALAEKAHPAALNDMTLRYVDEIRHPDVKLTQDWDSLIEAALAGPIGLLDAAPDQLSGLVVYEPSEERQLRVTYGAAPRGFIVDPSGPLKVQDQGAGPFFQLDIESEWKAPAEAVPPFAVDRALEISEQLHEPIRQAFESAITPRLRDYFRGIDRDENG